VTTEQQTLKLDQIRIDGGTQPRVKIDEQVVAEYAEQYSDGTDLKPVVVFFDGATYWLADGFHRYWANKKIESDYIFAHVHQGTQRDAILYSVGANATHGLRRTNADKRKAVLILLKDEEWRKWSDSDIARQCCVNQSTVTRHRTSLMQSISEPRSTDSSTRTYKTKHGTVATMKTGKIGRSPKRKFKPTGGIAKDAFSTRAPHSLQSRVPMKNVDLPLNNPRKAARCMISVYGEDYMRTLCDELNNLFKEG
jgi:hypothetical protein